MRDRERVTERMKKTESVRESERDTERVRETKINREMDQEKEVESLCVREIEWK